MISKITNHFSWSKFNRTCEKTNKLYAMHVTNIMSWTDTAYLSLKQNKIIQNAV